MNNASIRPGHTLFPRQLQLEDCLLENMGRRSYDAISISELCRQVGISRRAFYLHFKDKNDCLYSLIERKFRELLIETMAVLPENSTDLEACRTFLSFFREQRIFWDMMTRNRQVENMVAHIICHAVHVGSCFLPTKKTTVAQIDKDLLACLICSQIALMLRWHHRNYEDSLEEIAQKLLKITDMVIPGPQSQ